MQCLSRSAGRLPIAKTAIAALALPVLAPTVSTAQTTAADPPVDASRPLLVAFRLPGFGADASFVRQFDENFIRDYWRQYPERAIAAGRPEFAAHTRIPDARGRAKEIGQLNEWLSQLHRFDPGALGEANRSDWWLLKNAFESRRWALTEYRAWEWNPALYNAVEPLGLILAAGHEPLEERLRIVLKRLQDITPYYSAARQNLTAPTLEHTMLALREHERSLELLTTVLPRRVEESNLRANEKAMFARRIAAARLTVEDHLLWLRSLQAQLELNGARPFRLGRKLYEQKFAYLVQSGGTAEGLYHRALTEKEQLHRQLAALAMSLWPRHFPDTPAPEDRRELIARLVQQLASGRAGAEDEAPSSEPALVLTSGEDVFAWSQPTRDASLIRTYFGNGAAVEGWSSYRELVALESRDFTPEHWFLYSLSTLGAVCDALLDYQVHVQDMSEEEALDFLQREAFLTAAQAQRKWRQVQLTSVKLAFAFAGYSAIFDLREQLRRELGPRFDLVSFNRECEGYDGAPVRMIADIVRPALLARLD